jgi:hypothetical protein
MSLAIKDKVENFNPVVVDDTRQHGRWANDGQMMGKIYKTCNSRSNFSLE